MTDPATLSDGPVTLRTDDGAHFVIEFEGKPVGEAVLALRPDRPDTAAVSVRLDDAHRGRGVAVRALRLLVEHALGPAGLARVESSIDARDRPALRLAARAGLRREGLARGYARAPDGTRRDHILVGRLADDPAVGTGEMFRATLNAGLPRTRTIAQGLIRDREGKVLLAELVYKRYWDLPGGVVDPGESPAAAVLREIAEELQIQARVEALSVVSWLPPWKGWDDALLYLFDIGSADGSIEEAVAAAVLEQRELRAVHWADVETVRERCAPYTARLIEQATSRSGAAGVVYLENGDLPDWWDAQR